MYVNIVKSEAYTYIWNVEKSEINRCLTAQGIRKISHCVASQNPGNILLTSTKTLSTRDVFGFWMCDMNNCTKLIRRYLNSLLKSSKNLTCILIHTVAVNGDTHVGRNLKMTTNGRYFIKNERIKWRIQAS